MQLFFITAKFANYVHTCRPSSNRSSLFLFFYLDLASFIAVHRTTKTKTRSFYKSSNEFYRRYENLMQSMEFTLRLATQITLVRGGRMMEVRITQADVMAHASCRACGERFGEGMVVGVLRCSHSFHRRCAVGRFGMRRMCPACGIRI